MKGASTAINTLCGDATVGLSAQRGSPHATPAQSAAVAKHRRQFRTGTTEHTTVAKRYVVN